MRNFFFKILIIFFLSSSVIYAPRSDASSNIVVTKVGYKVLKDGSIKAQVFLNKVPDIKYKRLKSSNLVYVDLKKTRLGKTVKRKIRLPAPSFLKMIQSAQNQEDRVRIVFRLKGDVDFSVSKVSTPPQIVVLLNPKRKKKGAPVPTKEVVSPDSEGAISRAKRMDEAQLAVDSKEFGRAIEIYGEILKLPTNSYSGEAMEMLGVTYEKMGRSGKAKEVYKKYLKRYPSPEGSKRVKGRLKALKREEARLKGVFRKASRALGKGEYATAIKLFSDLLDSDYKRQTSLELLGASYHKNGEIEAAINESERYLKFYPKGKGAFRVNARLKMLWEKDNRSDKKFAEAGKALTGGEYERSVRLYKGLLGSGKYKERALEFLGLSYEKIGNNRVAVSTYEKYLKLYPKEDGSGRVAQRLAGLKTARSAAKKKLKKAKKRGDRSDYYGSFSQSYDRDDSYTDLGEILHNTSSLSTNFNLKYRGRNDLYDKRTVFAGGYERDFIDPEDSDFRLRRFYYDIKNKKKKVSMRIGRQQSSGGGVFSRFDGGIFGKRLSNEIKLNFLTGIPQDTTKFTSTYESGKYFFGLNLDIGTFKDRWDFNAFIVNQMVDRIIDRQGIGAEVRYFHNRKSVFGYVDYDLYFSELNVFLFSGNLTFANNTTINFSLDYRKSPLLATSNAINGAGVDSPADLSGVIGNTELKNRAKNLTATNRSLMLGFTRSLSEKLQVSGDLTVSSLTGTEGVPGPSLFNGGGIGVEGIEGTGNEFFYNLQFIRNSLIMSNDIAIFGLRYSDAKTTDTYSLLFNTRFPYTRNFKISPRMRMDYRVRQRSGNTEDRVRVRPTVRLNYRFRKTIWFDLDSGIDWDKNLTDQTDSTTSYSISLGYRYEF